MDSGLWAAGMISIIILIIVIIIAPRRRADVYIVCKGILDKRSDEDVQEKDHGPIVPGESTLTYIPRTPDNDDDDNDVDDARKDIEDIVDHSCKNDDDDDDDGEVTKRSGDRQCRRDTKDRNK